MVSWVGRWIPIYSGKQSESQVKIEALKQKAKINNLTSGEIFNIAYDYSDDTMSDYIGLFLDEKI